jgi:hypothetical protein
MRFRTNGLTGMIMGSDQVNLLLGRIQRYWVRFGSAMRCAPMNPLGRGAGRLRRAGHAHVVRLAGPRCRFGPNGTKHTLNLATRWNDYNSPFTHAGGGVGEKRMSRDRRHVHWIRKGSRSVEVRRAAALK